MAPSGQTGLRWERPLRARESPRDPVIFYYDYAITSLCARGKSQLLGAYTYHAAPPTGDFTLRDTVGQSVRKLYKYREF